VTADREQVLLFFEAHDIVDFATQAGNDIGGGDRNGDHELPGAVRGDGARSNTHGHARGDAVIDQYRHPSGDLEPWTAAKIGLLTALDFGQLALAD
jgi:hypothetical protein